jgi:hypothetical protein
MAQFSWIDWLNWAPHAFIVALALYLFRLNQLLKGTPEEVRKLSGSRWTAEQLRKTYDRLSAHPVDYIDQLPPKLERRYIVTGGSGEYQVAWYR